MKNENIVLSSKAVIIQQETWPFSQWIKTDENHYPYHIAKVEFPSISTDGNLEDHLQRKGNKQSKEIAERIVETWNSHDDLVKQNKELLEIAENYLVTLNGFEDDNIISNDGRLTLGKVKEAINNAKY